MESVSYKNLSTALEMVKKYVDSRIQFLESDDFDNLSASNCVEGVLYCELGSVIDTEGEWHFGDGFPLKFT